MTTKTLQTSTAHSAAGHTRVAIFETYIFDRKLYGNTRYIVCLFKYLDPARYAPILFAPVENSFLDVIDELGGRRTVVQAPRLLRQYAGTILAQGLWGKIATAASIAWYSLPLGARFVAERIDIVQCHSVRAVITAGLAARLSGRRLIWYVKGELDNPLLDRIAFALSDRILFQGETNKWRRYPDLVRKHRSKIEIVPNGIDLDPVIAAGNTDLSGLKRELGVDDRNINIVYVGALMPAKGIGDLLEAMMFVRKAVPNARLYLVGDHGSDGYLAYSTELEATVHSDGLSDVIFTGWRDNAEEIVSLMDIYVLPSHAEGVSRSAMEAMALGKAVVSTAVGSIPDLITDGENGLTVPPHAPETLAEKLILLCHDASLRKRLGDNARKTIFDEYSIQANIARLQQVFEDLT